MSVALFRQWNLLFSEVGGGKISDDLERTQAGEFSPANQNPLGVRRGVPVMFWVLAIFLTVYVGFCTALRDNRWDADAWEHHRAVAALTRQLWHPENPTYVSAAPSIRYSPYVVTQAFICRVTGLDPYRMVSITAVLNTAFLALAVLAVLASFGEAASAAWALVVMVGMYGAVPGYANSYALADLPWHEVNPSAWAFDLILLAWAIFKWRINRGNGWWMWPVLGAMLTVAVLDHAMTGLFGLLGLLVIAITRPGALRWKYSAGVMVLAAAVFALCICWPWYDFFRAVRMNQDRDYWFNGAILKSMMGTWAAAALLCGLAAMTQIRRDLVRTFLVGAAVTFFLGAAAFASRSALLARLPMPGMIFLHLPIAVFLTHSGVSHFKTWGGRIHALKTGGGGAAMAAVECMVIVVLAWCLAPQIYDVLEKPYLARVYVARILRKEDKQLDLRARLTRLLEPVGGQEVVLSDVVTSWPVPSFSGRVVAALHYEYFVPSQPERVRDVETFFAADSSPARRRELLRQYNVRWILLNETFIDPRSFRQLRDSAAMVRSDGPLLLMDAAVWLKDHDSPAEN